MAINGRTTLLIVDDDIGHREMVMDVFSSHGLEIVVAKDGRTALDVMANNEVEAVLCDLMMPELDGLAFLQAVRMKGSEIPIILFTGYGDEKKLLEAMRLGATDFLTKPVELDRLEGLVTRAIEIGRLERINTNIRNTAIAAMPQREREAFYNNEKRIGLLKALNNVKMKKAS